MKNPRLSLALLMAVSLSISGCGGVTLGPRVEIRYVIVKPGQPIRILENKTVRGERLDGEPGSAPIDIGGWIAMPPEHWDAVKERLEKVLP